MRPLSCTWAAAPRQPAAATGSRPAAGAPRLRSRIPPACRTAARLPQPSLSRLLRYPSARAAPCKLDRCRHAWARARVTRCPPSWRSRPARGQPGAGPEGAKASSRGAAAARRKVLSKTARRRGGRAWGPEAGAAARSAASAGIPSALRGKWGPLPAKQRRPRGRDALSWREACGARRPRSCLPGRPAIGSGMGDAASAAAVAAAARAAPEAYR